MTYIDAVHDRKRDVIKVVEQVKGKMVFKEYSPEYVFYYEDPRGTHRTMWGEPCIKYQTNDYKKFQKELGAARHKKKIHESDINPVFRCLENNYRNKPLPELNIAFFDIEVDFDPERGFASPWDPFAKITAITVYLSHLKELVTLVLKPELPKDDPDYLSYEKAEEICSEFKNTHLFDDEAKLLETFVDLIQESNIITGYNSTGFDIPYTINRIERIVDKELSSRLCLWGERPKKRKFVKFKKEQATYDLVGRVHMDYLDLYQKYTYQELHSYRLDYVGEIEVGENKVPYDGTLDELYKRDFKTFIDYNRQDVMLLVKIDDKLRLIGLSNQIAHDNCVLIPTTMGSVAWIDQAIVIETHDRGMVAPSKKNHFDEEEEGDDAPAAGAYVADPEVGLKDSIACGDINSLYPSTIRALNMGPDTLIGQILPYKTQELLDSRIAQGSSPTAAWHELFCLVEFDMVRDKSSEKLIVEFEDGTRLEMTGAEMHELIFNEDSQYILSANGTIFRKDVEAVIPGLLEKWYAQRKVEQGKAKALKALTIGIDVSEIADMLV